MSFLRALGLVLLLPLASQATLLGSFFTQDLTQGAGNPGASSTIFLNLCFFNPPGPIFDLCRLTSGSVNLFAADLILSSADAGATFVATSANDPAFAAAAQALTDGVNGQIEVDFGPIGGTATRGSFYGIGATEASWFFGDPSGANGIDFAGFAIDSIDLTLSNDFSVTPYPSIDSTAINGSLLVQVFGHVAPVPEPSTAWLVGAGIAGLFMRRPC